MTRPFRLLFVCTGNVCRSPMAHVMAEAWAPSYGVEVEVRSASTLGLVDRPAERNIVAVLREIGLDGSAHLSQPLTRELIQWADRIGVMELAHVTAIRELEPEISEDAIVLMGAFVGKPEIADPIGSWTRGPYRRAREEIQTGVQRMLDQLSRLEAPND